MGAAIFLLIMFAATIGFYRFGAYMNPRHDAKSKGN